MRSQALISTALIGLAVAHGDGTRNPVPKVPENANWITKHMAEEHHMAGWDDSAFFSLHDYNSDGRWQGDEILRTYGLMDDSNKHVSAERRKQILDDVVRLIDTDGDGQVTLAEWLSYTKSGKTLPDMGTGPGHHGDDEYEYEIHHWEKYHNEDTKMEDLTHPEDIEHFKKHDEIEDEQRRLEALDKLSVVESNIPSKFLRQR
ncbi:hypothetical protein V2G26_001214 [Clonostachys chloroleuca]|uniref:EF-hand domain-containing protein n=2 Tax=Clonostachys TaxID=110564 RepID=A0A9N9VTL7_9HYPO|nr:unnamed protein product [Clonostachys rhizophaga]CAI6098548.1 unnamed protein product [Clonostachys chloroleuca]